MAVDYLPKKGGGKMATYEAIMIALTSNLVLVGVLTFIVNVVKQRKK